LHPIQTGGFRPPKPIQNPTKPIGALRHSIRKKLQCGYRMILFHNLRHLWIPPKNICTYYESKYIHVKKIPVKNYRNLFFPSSIYSFSLLFIHLLALHISLSFFFHIHVICWCRMEVKMRYELYELNEQIGMHQGKTWKKRKKETYKW